METSVEMSRALARAKMRWMDDRARKGLPVQPESVEDWRSYLGALRRVRAALGLTIERAAVTWGVPFRLFYAELERYRDACVAQRRKPEDLLPFDPADLRAPWETRTVGQIALDAALVAERNRALGYAPEALPVDADVAEMVATVRTWIGFRWMSREAFEPFPNPIAWHAFLDHVIRERAERGHSIAIAAHQNRVPPALLYAALEDYRDRCVATGAEPAWLSFVLDPPALLAPWDDRTAEQIAADEPARLQAHRDLCRNWTPPKDWPGQLWW